MITEGAVTNAIAGACDVSWVADSLLYHTPINIRKKGDTIPVAAYICKEGSSINGLNQLHNAFGNAFTIKLCNYEYKYGRDRSR